MRNRFFIGLASAVITFGTLTAALGPRFMNHCGRRHWNHHHWGHCGGYWQGNNNCAGYNNSCTYPADRCGGAHGGEGSEGKNDSLQR